jgi:Cu2+-exporting ATPase
MTKMQTEAGDALCYHCGKVAEKSQVASLFCQDRVFCSKNCKAVAVAIADNGLEDYYTHRSAVPFESKRDVAAKNYDHKAVRQSFVRETDAGHSASFILEGVSCSACLWLVEQTLRKLSGVKDVRVDQTSHQAFVSWDPDALAVSDVLTAVDGIGFTAYPFDATHRETLVKEQRRRSLERILLAGMMMMPVMGFQISGYWVGVQPDGSLATFLLVGRWFMLAAVTIVLAYSGADFFAGAWRDFKNRRVGMDIPIVLGLTIAWAGSFWATTQGTGDTYFDSIVMFVFFVLLARVWELNGRIRAANDIDRMMKIIPQEVTRIGFNGPERVMLPDVEVGQILRVEPGETVPLDGLLLDQDSTFDESLLTGESLPVLRTVGQAAVAGSCNIDQPVNIKVTRAFGGSTLAEMQALVRRGISERPPFAQAAERIVPWLVIAILCIAMLTALAWWYINPALVIPNVVAVLIVTCPCALALATPVTLAAAAGQMSKAGILATRMSSVEALQSAKTVVLDKTGTLTMGRPTLVATHKVKNGGAGLSLAAAMNASSEHSIGRAFVLAHGLTGLQPISLDVPVRNFPGKGLQVDLPQGRVRLGSLDFTSPILTTPDEAWITAQLAQGHTVICLTVDDEMSAFFSFADILRPGARDMVQDFKVRGFRLAILSGDRQETVDHIASTLGIDECLGALSPNDKVDWVRTKQKEKSRILMVGDGINDAPVLTCANVSVSFSQATDLARQSSDFILLNDDLRTLTRLADLANKTTVIIRQNLGWALSYNIIAVPAAAFGFVPPWAAAIGMSASSFIVVFNALRMTK